MRKTSLARGRPEVETWEKKRKKLATSQPQTKKRRKEEGIDIYFRSKGGEKNVFPLIIQSQGKKEAGR